MKSQEVSGSPVPQGSTHGLSPNLTVAVRALYRRPAFVS